MKIGCPHPSREQIVPLDVQAAVCAGHIRLQFQPEFDLASRALLAVEALTRWDDPGSGALETAAVIENMEQSGQIIELGQWVLRTACSQYAVWRSQFPDLSFTLRVNASPLQLSERSFAASVEQVLIDNRLAPKDLCIEVTETSAPSDPAVAAASVRTLRSNGVRIALDDFGAGRNGLARLRYDMFDVLKIDRAFVAELAPGSRDSIILESVVALARNLGMELVAEGIETETSLAELLRLGIRRGQGYLLGTPREAEAIGSLLADAS